MAQLPRQEVNGIAVVVDNDVITQDDVLRYVAPSVELMIRQYGDQPEVLNQKLMEAQQDGLNQLIERKLILHEFEKAGYSMPDSVVEEEVERRVRDRFGGDRVALTRTLQSEGLTMDAWRKRVREDYILSAMRAKHASGNILISPYKIEKYYADNLEEFKLGDQVKLRSIMISSRGKPNAELVRELMKELKQSLDEGAPFADLAKIYSEETISSKGGDRGWVERDGLRKELADAAFSLPVGGHSDVIQLGETYWLLHVEAVRKNHARTLPEVRDEIEATLRAQEQNRLHQKWIDRLKEKSFIRYF
jgi:parvulin-like peptidyl-prolyl isomerase